MYGPVDDGNGLSASTVSVLQELVVDTNVLEDLDDCKRSAGQNTFAGSGRGLVFIPRLAKSDRSRKVGSRDGLQG